MKNKIYILLIMALFTFGCERLEFEPQSELLIDEAMQTPDDLQRVLNSCYDVMANTVNGRSQYFSDLLSDDLNRPFNNQDFLEVYNHNMLFFNGSLGSFYGEYYTTIFRVNSLLENYDQIDGVTDDLVQKLENEGKFLRAFCHFELVKLFAHPYNYSSDNSHLGVSVVTQIIREPQPRNTAEETYAQIIQDLQDVEDALPEENEGNVYATKYAAKALLARVYFYQQRYAEAIEKCNEIINSGKFTLNPTVNRFGQTPSQEAIFYITSTNGNNRSGGLRDQYSSQQDNPQLTISRELFNLFTDTLDARRNWFVPTNFGEANEQIKLNKFDADFFQIPVLSLTEILLIRAEALCYTQGDKATIVSDVNQIIERAYGTGVNLVFANSDYPALLERIRLERRKEFIGEGDRIYQIKRLGLESSQGNPNGQNISVRGATWDCNGMILQFPISERSDVFELNPTGGC